MAGNQTCAKMAIGGSDREIEVIKNAFLFVVFCLFLSLCLRLTRNRGHLLMHFYLSVSQFVPTSDEK